MNADSTFYIGKDHTICEDYALAGVVSNKLAYAIVCDGCSASDDVEFGARIIARSAKECINNYLPFNTVEFGQTIINKASEIYDLFPSLNSTALDATLVMALVHEKYLTAYMFGDGVIIHRSKKGITKVHVNLTSGAPDYLSYHLNENRKKAYHQLIDNKRIISVGMPDGRHINVNEDPFIPYVISTQVEEGDVIAVISDGINSFQRSDSNDIPWETLIDEFTGYKTFEGEFVLRRISAFKRKCIKEQIHHYDDISVAAIVV